MNNRIAELIVEAGKTMPGDKHIDADFANKLAGLVVLECMEIFSKELPEPGNGMLDVVNRVCNVAEHFGVDNETN